jgi:hypothetical protein
LRHDPERLVGQLAQIARPAHNETAQLSASDTQPGDLAPQDGDCPTGYCHLGRDRVPSREAYGAGVLDLTRWAG